MCRMHSGNMIASDLPAVRLISETGRNARDPSVSRSASVCVAPTNVSICGTLEVFSVSAHRRHRSRMTYGDLSDPLASVLCGLPSPPPSPRDAERPLVFRAPPQIERSTEKKTRQMMRKEAHSLFVWRRSGFRFQSLVLVPLWLGLAWPQ
jgi:hypothetical protein